MTTEQPISGNAARVRRYRAKHRRIDYVPIESAARIIEEHLRVGTSQFIAGVIDRLVLEGDKAMRARGTK